MSKFSRILLPLAAILILALAAACAAPSAPPPPAAATAAPAAATAAPQATQAPAQPNAVVGIVTATPVNPNAEPSGVTASVFTKLNLNSASRQEFFTIPNVDERIIAEFEQSRPFTSIGQFRQQLGNSVDPATVAAFENFVFVPIDVNQADAETLQQIPSVTPDIAAELIAGRPYGTNQNFLAKLVTLVSAEDVAVAQNYLAQ